jgi:raffinose/stachyose/melibiose transport system substrate-binding protein
MRSLTALRSTVALGATIGLAALSLAGCSASSGGGTEMITLQVDNSANTVNLAKGLIADFERQNPKINVKLDPRVGGADGDNVVKTRLATGAMDDVFGFASGSQMQGTAPEKNLVDLKNEPWMTNIDPGFKKVVSAGSGIYGAPAGTLMAGAILYNKKVYSSLGLSVPTTWDELIANSETIKSAGKTAVIETFGDTWTSQLLFLGDFANVEAAEPGWANGYTDNKKKFANDKTAAAGFYHIADVFDKKLMNNNFGTAKVGDGLKMLADGTGVQYPMLTSQVSELAKSYPEAVKDIGVFAIPSDNASVNRLTTWFPNAVYIPKSTKHLDAAKKLVAFIASTQGCDSQTRSVGVQGPYVIKGCGVPSDIAPYVTDMTKYVDKKDGSGAALEFLSPIKGPSLEQILVAVGSGLTPPKAGAAQYDQDVTKQALQLGLPGW